MPWNIANLKELKFNNTYLYLGGFKNEKKFKYKENGYKCTCFSNVIYNNDYK